MNKRNLDHAYQKSQARKSHSESQNDQANILHKKDQDAYNNCFTVGSGAIKQVTLLEPCWKAIKTRSTDIDFN